MQPRGWSLFFPVFSSQLPSEGIPVCPSRRSMENSDFRRFAANSRSLTLLLKKSGLRRIFLDNFEKLIEQKMEDRDFLIVIFRIKEDREIAVENCNRTYSELTGVSKGICAKDFRAFCRCMYTRRILDLTAAAEEKDAIYEFIQIWADRYWSCTVILNEDKMIVLGRRIVPPFFSYLDQLQATRMKQLFPGRLQYSILLEHREGAFYIESCSPPVADFFKSVGVSSIAGRCFDSLLSERKPMLLSGDLLRLCMKSDSPVAMLDMSLSAEESVLYAYFFHALPINHAGCEKLFLVIVPLSEREFLSFHKKSVSKYEAILKGSPYCMGLYKYKQGILIKNKQLEELLERLQFSGQDILALPFIRECRLKEKLAFCKQKILTKLGTYEEYICYAIPETEDESIMIALLPETESGKLSKLALKQLSNREREIIELVIDGYTNKYIAKRLRLSEGTVKKTIYNAYKKLNVNSRMELLNLVK